MDIGPAARAATMRLTPSLARMLAMTCSLLLVLSTTWTMAEVRAADDGPEWEPMEAPARTESARLEPSLRQADGIPTDAYFTLRSADGSPAADLAADVTVDPPAEIRVIETSDPAVARLVPTEGLRAGTRYHIELRAVDGSPTGSWVYRTQAPLQVIGTLPDDRHDSVRPDTGIEITFDHQDPVRPRRYFSIEPDVKGRFEVRGNTLSFIPARPLQSRTRYTVSLRPGLGVKGSDARLEEPFAFSFQTRPAKGDRESPVRFATEVIESAPGEPPTAEVWARQRDRRDLDVDVHRLKGAEQAIEAMQSIQSTWEWGAPPTLAVPTDDLRSVGRVAGSLQRIDTWDRSRQALTLPRPLARGWYLLTIDGAGRGRQAILQVSDLATYAHVTRTDSLFWINSVADQRPVENAEVSLVGGPTLGSTDARGLLRVETPDALISNDPVPLVRVRSGDAAVLLPFAVGERWNSPNVERGYERLAPSEHSWTYLTLDRWGYRPTDAINVWGLVRSRDDGSVPTKVELHLLREQDWGDEVPTARPVLATTTATPSPTGVYSASLAYEDLPLGYYVVDVVVDGERYGSEWLEIRSIVKPAYRLSMTTDRRAFMAGESIDVAVQASFFDGTAVPAAPLAVNSQRAKRQATTDGGGVARTSVPAFYGRSLDRQIGLQRIMARPDHPEQGEITGGTQVAVAGSSLYLDGKAVMKGNRVRLTGHAYELDLDRLDRQMTATSPNEESLWRYPTMLDPRGRPAAGVRVKAKVTRMVPVRKKTGTVYDFIAKRVIPTFEWNTRRRPAGAFEVTTDAAGAFSLEFDGEPGSSYFVDLTTTDAQGRAARRRIWADEPSYREDPGARPYLAVIGGGNGSDYWREASIGEELKVELRQGRRQQPRGGPNRYLFLVHHRGLQDHQLRQKPVFGLTFDEVYVPSMDVGAVRFTGESYIAVPDGLHIDLKAEERALGLEITPAQDRYAPGDAVELSVRTTDKDGRPVPASVVLHAIDEKLYAMGLVGTADPLEDVYSSVGSGLVRSYASHQRPGVSPRSEGGGDTAGGGPARADFRDVILFRQVETDDEGQASITFDTSDDLTSWRIAGSGVSDDIEVGTGTALVSVGLPFFVEVISAEDYLVADAASISVRAYGGALSADDPVTFTVTAPSLGLDGRALAGTAFEPIEVPLPPLTEGVHDITVSASADVDGGEVDDAMVRQIRVRPSRLVQWRSAHLPLSAGQTVPGGPSLSDIVISDEGRGRHYPALLELATSAGPRADQALAASQARHLLARWFPGSEDGLPAASFDAAQFQRSDGSVALLPFGGRDEALSFLVALATPDAVDGPRLARWFRGIQNKRNTTRERALRAAAARAALGEDVMGDLESIAAEGPLTPRDSLIFALGLASVGAHDQASDIQRELVAEHGQRLGQWVRLRLPTADGSDRATSDQVTWDTAVLAILAAALGDDDTAWAAHEYVLENLADRTIDSLQHVAVIERLIERTGSEPASFELAIDDDRRTIDLDPGAMHRMTLTAAQRASVELTPVLGTLGVSSSWQEPLDQHTPGQSPAISVRRSVRPQGPIAANGTVEVTIDVGLGDDAAPGCYLVTDMAPSGLAPIRQTAGWPKRRGGPAEPSRVVTPLSIQGQRVDFCIARAKKRPVQTLRYTARVVTPGTYAWEPTLVQSSVVPDVWRLGEPGQLVLGEPSPEDRGSSPAEPVPSTRKGHENALLERLTRYDCRRWRKDDQPFEFGALAAVQCSQPDVGINQVALFAFPDADQLRDFWDRRVDQIELGPASGDAACSSGRPGLVDVAGGQAVCYLSGSGAGVAKIRWIDEGTLTYGVLDATDGDVAALFAWFRSNR